MQRIIHRNPTFNLSIIDRKKELSSFLPFDEKSVLLFGFARIALYEGLRILNISEGDNILIPNYVCNVVIAPMHKLNIKVKFYEVDSNLVPLWADLEKRIDKNTKALLIVNYFGFPNDLITARTFCDKNKIYLIEDNAHSFLSFDNGKPLGSTGDISFFSFRKIAPISNGAALVVNNKSFADKLSYPGYLRENNRDLRFILKNLCSLLIRSSKSKVTDFEASRINDIGEEYNLEKYFSKFSGFSYFLLRRLNFNYIKEQRRRVYGKWLRLFLEANAANLRVVFPVLKDGVVPSCFPVLVENQKQFISDMWSRGIECFPWPFLPKDSPENYLSKRVVCLPSFPYFNLDRFFEK